VSHAIPLHTADRLERTFEALSQRVESSGDEGWVMRILAMLISRCLDHFVAMIEDLLAKIRAGTIVLPDWAYDPPTVPARREPGCQRMPLLPESADPAASPQRRDAPCRVLAAAAPRTNAFGAVPAEAPEQSNTARRRIKFTVVSLRLPIRRPTHGPRGVAGYPSAVPRWPPCRIQRATRAADARPFRCDIATIRTSFHRSPPMSGGGDRPLTKPNTNDRLGPKVAISCHHRIGGSPWRNCWSVTSRTT
jgi:hypothetical protein